MSPEQEANLAEIKQSFLEAVDAKYRKGQAEHGSDLWERDLLQDALDECVDLYTYLITLQKEQRRTQREVRPAQG